MNEVDVEYALQTDPIGIVKVEFGLAKVREMTGFAHGLIEYLAS